mgnify:FL=1
MRTYYLEKMDKPKFSIRKYKIEEDNFVVYADLNKEKNVSKIIKVMIKNDIEYVVLSKTLTENKNFINALNANNIKIFNGRWLEKYLTFEILEYIINQKAIKKEETEIAITTNEITDLTIETIKILSKQYKKLIVVTNHIEKLRRVEKELYDNDGILIIVANNIKKSLLKPQIILNLDFNMQVLNKYKINENAIIINVEGDMKIRSKRFSGININNYEIVVGREENIWRENMSVFEHKDLLEATLYIRDTFNNIRRKIMKNKVSIKELYGENGKIERFS